MGRPKGRKNTPQPVLTPEERWAKEDAELEAFCQSPFPSGSMSDVPFHLQNTTFVTSRKSRRWEYAATAGRIGKTAAAVIGQHERATKLGRPSTLTVKEWERILDAAKHRCVYCGESGLLAIEHLQPLSAGGDNTAWNVAPACKRCNSSKHDADMLTWLERVGFDAEEVFARIDAIREAVLG
jgi:5-methylcytosine-specific restriction endonuclease McrA